MASFNKVILVGNLTRDPELRVTGTGLSICKIGLAVNRSYTSKDGESKDETTYVDVDAFGKQAEILGKAMRIGAMLWVKDNKKRAALNWNEMTRELVLELSKKNAALYGEVCEARLRSLASTLNARSSLLLI